MRFVFVALALLLSAGACWAQDCPPANAKPGWVVETYEPSAKLDGLMPDAPSNSTVVQKFPLRFGQIPGVAGASSISKFAFNGNFRVCEAGRYEFTLIIEGGKGPNFRQVLCQGEMQQGTEKLFSIGTSTVWAMIKSGADKPFNGYAELERGWQPLKLILHCGVQKYGGRTSIMQPAPNDTYLGTIIALRVRGPNDGSPRDFRPGEITQVTR